jgi:hypothetical protein
VQLKVKCWHDFPAKFWHDFCHDFWHELVNRAPDSKPSPRSLVRLLGYTRRKAVIETVSDMPPGMLYVMRERERERGSTELTMG